MCLFIHINIATGTSRTKNTRKPARLTILYLANLPWGKVGAPGSATEEDTAAVTKLLGYVPVWMLS